MPSPPTKILSSLPSIHHHLPLISTLKTLYTLITDLYPLPISTLQLLPHLPGSIFRSSAQENGFSDPSPARDDTDELFTLLHLIPYLNDFDVPIAYDTYPLSYLEEEFGGEGDGAWDFARDPTYQTDEGEKEEGPFWGKKILVLTKGVGAGTEILYEVEKATLIAWSHFNDPPWTELASYPLSSPQNPLAQFIISFLTLNTFPLSPTQLSLLRAPEQLSYPGINPSEADLASWNAEIEGYRKERSLRDVFIRCGWDVDAIGIVERRSGLAEGRQERSEERGEGELDEKPLWERLEKARMKAVQYFDREKFDREKDEWGRVVWALKHDDGDLS
ncbi:hypothetical protein MMC25_005304 [Agyrium rufum]|nr:hypothetical protein [Agyrium rufum]